ncbi:MAG: transposase [Deltaproteobacteria bacterium]|nr:transposase [Deltaproteobacteria bacterium]
MATAAWQRHDPTATALYGIVREHLESFVVEATERAGRALPKYVEDALRAYLRCGVLACGFGRARCATCGCDILVAFSCKGRGACPSCAARRMCGGAATLVDRVLPAVPLRQWVLSVPHPLRVLLASDAGALTAVTRIFVEELIRWQGAAPGRGGAPSREGGAVSVQQRFGGSLNLTPHLHVLCLDGVYARVGGGVPVFEPGEVPTRADLERIVGRVRERVWRWLRRHRGDVLREVAPEDRANEAPAVAALGACQQLALGAGRGSFGTVHEDRRGRAVVDDEERRFGARAPRSQAAESAGFNLHANVTVSAWDHEGRERLCRYLLRPTISLERLTVLEDGRVAYRLKYPVGGRATHRLMTPLEFLARVAALIPPPRHPLTRYHGVLAPNSSWRAAVVPARPTARPIGCAATAAVGGTTAGAAAGNERVLRHDPAAARVAVVPTGGLSRIDWATLLRRTYDVDALACGRCGGRMRFIAVITDGATIARILDHLGEPSSPPSVVRARSPMLFDCDPPPD